MKHIVFLRHGLSTANFDGVVQGQKDYALHPLGVMQARQLADYWLKQGRNFDQTICSPLLRAKGTAEIVARALSSPIVEEPIWLERKFGEGEGLTYSQIREHLAGNPNRWSSYKSVFADSESEWELTQRASRGVKALLQSKYTNLLVVSHGGILSAAIRSILGIPLPKDETRPPGFRFDNTGYTELSFDQDDSRWQILCHNMRSHLEHNE
jgi:broad specificity phosphatase PhoE